MSREPASDARVWVFVGPGESADEVVEHAIGRARDARAAGGALPAVEIRILAPSDVPEVARTEARVEAVAAAVEGTDVPELAIDVLRLPRDDPETRTRAIVDAIGDGDVECVVVGAEHVDTVERLRERFGPIVETVPDASPDRRRLLNSGGPRRIVVLFGLAYLFYLTIGGFAGGLDLLTGAISAAVVAVSLSRVSLQRTPTAARTGRRLLRTIAFLPVLLWEVAKANVAIAGIILHPRLPIDPSMDETETGTREDLERTVLANSITLTPGTLTVDVREGRFTVHTLTSRARRDLARGRLRRLVAWVFHGRDGRSDAAGGGDR